MAQKSGSGNPVEELLQQVQAMGSGNGGGRRRPPPPRNKPPQIPLPLIGIAVALGFVVWAAFSSFYTVQPEERAVV
ncbi:MAG: hypothetical protein KDI51_14545, partial [Xanthomonadales bacterium]|nr:hypothetical protein [Xanthomonadales bacterium]